MEASIRRGSLEKMELVSGILLVFVSVFVLC